MWLFGNKNVLLNVKITAWRWRETEKVMIRNTESRWASLNLTEPHGTLLSLTEPYWVAIPGLCLEHRQQWHISCSVFTPALVDFSDPCLVPSEALAEPSFPDGFVLSFPMRTNYMYGLVRKEITEMYAFTACLWLKAKEGGIGTPFSYSVPGQPNELVLLQGVHNPVELLINDKVRPWAARGQSWHTADDDDDSWFRVRQQT